MPETKEQLNYRKYMEAKRRGYKTKSYKLQEKTAEEFKKACISRGVCQGYVLNDLMELWINNGVVQEDQKNILKENKKVVDIR